MSTPDPTSTSLYPTPDPSTPAALHPNGPSTSMYPTPTPLQLKSPTPTSAPPPPVQPRAQPNYKLAQTIYAHKRAVTALRWTRDGRGLVTAGADGYVHLFSMTTTTTSTSASTQAQTDVAGSSTSTQPPASTSTSTSSLSHFKTLRTHRSGINDLSLSPDDLYFATASDDCTARIFALPSPHLPSLRPSPLPSTVNAAEPDDLAGSASATPAPGQAQGSGSAGPSVSQMITPLRTLEAHTAPILSLSFSPRSNLLVTGSFDESAIVWDVRTGQALRKLPAHSEAVWTTGWDREGGVVLTGSADGLVRLWDASTGQCLKTLDNDSNSPVTCALFTPNPFYLMTATASPETTVRVYNIHTARVVKTLRPEGENGAVVSLGQGTGMVGGGRGAVVCAFTRAPVASGRKVQGEVMRSEGEVGRGRGDGDVDMDSEENQEVAAQAAASAQRASAEYQPQSRTPDTWVLAGTDKGGIVVWDLATRRLAQVLEGHMAGVLALAVHPTGAWVASGSAEPERTIKIWRHVDE